MTKIQWTQYQKGWYPSSIKKERDECWGNPVTANITALVYSLTGSWGRTEGGQVGLQSLGLAGLSSTAFDLLLPILSLTLVCVTVVGPEPSGWVCLHPHSPSPSCWKEAKLKSALAFHDVGCGRGEAGGGQKASCFQLFLSAKMWIFFFPPSEDDASFQGVFKLQTVSSGFFFLLPSTIEFVPFRSDHFL